MAIYHGLARIYDELMASIDYEQWAEYITSIVRRSEKEVASVLDIACGTGSTSIPLAKQGWRVTGVDISLPMLQQARRKAADAKEDVLFLQQDIRQLDFVREFDLVTCFQDGLNYLLSEEELNQAFQGIYNLLSPGGLFIFDLNLVEKYSFSASNEISFIDMEEYSLIYETSYDPANRIWEIKVTGFIREEQQYSKFQEIHQEMHHQPEDVEKSLVNAGFNVKDKFSAFTFDAPQPDDRRIFIVAQKDEGRE
ncbi:MAG: class I SAM-dependent DNA methyltransferase [Bacillota bacterium]